jgi:hypothetical protein
MIVIAWKITGMAKVFKKLIVYSSVKQTAN